MRQTSVFRVTGEICFYFSVLNVFSAFYAWRLPMALFAAACLLLGLVIVRCQNAAARLALSLLPGLCFLAGPPDPLLLFPAVAWLYFLLVMTRGWYAMPLEEYRRSYTLMLVICLFFLAANIASATIYRGRLISADSLIYAFAFLLLGVTAMRRMQMGTELSRQWKIRNALSVIGFPVLAAALSVGLFLLLRFTHWGLQAILTPLGRILNWLFHKLFPTGNAPIEEMSLPEALSLYKSNMPLEWNGEGGGAVMAESGGGGSEFLIERAAGIGAWVLLGLLLAATLYLVLTRARRNSPLAEGGPDGEEPEDIPAGGGRRRRRRAAPVLGNARQLRRIYRSYLEYRHGQGMPVGKADTSADILAREQETGENADAKRLRELYLAARYGEPGAVTREQVQEAQACLERIVG